MSQYRDNTGKQMAKFVARIAENLPNDDQMTPDDRQKWINNPSALRKALHEIFCPTPEFRTWKTIKIGTGFKTVDEFRGAFKVISVCADEMLDSEPVFTIASQEVELNLVRTSVAELGFKRGAQRCEIYGRAKELGLDLCPAEVALHLRLEYQDQPFGERLRIAMEPRTIRVGFQQVFELFHGSYSSDSHSRLWLDSDTEDRTIDRAWKPNQEVVFVSPK